MPTNPYIAGAAAGKTAYVLGVARETARAGRFSRRVVVDALPLRHYASLTDRPGFIRILKQLIEELKAGMIAPEDFSCAVAGPGGEPRLEELAHIVYLWVISATSVPFSGYLNAYTSATISGQAAVKLFHLLLVYNSQG